MGFLDSIKKRAKKDIKTIVLPESMDRRTMEAADTILKEGISKLIIIGKDSEIKSNSRGLDISKATIINPENSELTDELINKLYELRKEKGMTLEEAKKLLLEDYMYYACMLVKTGRADGVVSGACHSSANTLRPALQIIKTAPNVELVSAFFLMIVPECEYGADGTFIFADSGLVQNPTSHELAAIAASSARSFEELVEVKPVVAMLSHSTKGSAKHEDVDKVVEAVKVAKIKYPKYLIDGEFQLDAAIDEDIAKQKAAKSKVAGHANVLVFPDLDAGNIGYKLVQGIASPINDLSRGCSPDDIVGVVAITCVQAQNK